MEEKVKILEDTPISEENISFYPELLKLQLLDFCVQYLIHFLFPFPICHLLPYLWLTSVICVHVVGVIVAVLGMERDDEPGKFQVEDVCFQDLPAQPERTPLEEDKYWLPTICQHDG